MVIFSFPHHCYVYELKFLCKKGLSSLILASLTYISMDHKYLFCPWVIIQYQLYYSGCSFGHGGVIMLLCPSMCLHLFKALSYFLTPQGFPGSFLFFPTSALESATSPRGPHSFQWRYAYSYWSVVASRPLSRVRKFMFVN